MDSDENRNFMITGITSPLSDGTRQKQRRKSALRLKRP